MDSILEQQRNLHEERERLTDAIMEESLLSKPTRREKINSDHRVADYQNRYKAATIKLNNLYQDKTGHRKEVVNFMIGVKNKGNPMEAFLEKYKDINDKHNMLNKRQNQVKGTRLVKEFMVAQNAAFGMGHVQQHKNAASAAESNLTDITAHVGSISYEFDELKKVRKILDKGPKNLDVDEMNIFRKTLDMTSKTVFSTEESYGKFIDLHEPHLEFLNLKGVDRDLEYLDYLQVFDNLADIGKNTKKTKSYKSYLENLIASLSDYISRSQPLYDQKLQLAKLQHEFNDEWSKGTFKGWQRASMGSAMKKDVGELNMDEFESIEELEFLGMERLKNALKAVGLKCGGDLKQRATRLFATKTKAVKNLPKKWRAPVDNSAPIQDVKITDTTDTNDKNLAFLEAQIYKLVSLLEEYRKDTLENIRRKQGKTAQELAEEEADDSDEDIEEIDETLIGYNNEGEEEIIYNPKNLPLDWDGKPIPYWLYKLHGLNKSYPCEICGGYVYRGLKPFQKHFSEWRHAHGMRCLGG